MRTPKIHVVDSGLAASLAGLGPEDWIGKRARMGHLLESFVTQQLVTLAGWTDPDLRFWHFRDRDGREVDLVMTLGTRTWGIVLYNGRDILPLAGKNMLAVPLSELWER